MVSQDTKGPVVASCRAVAAEIRHMVEATRSMARGRPELVAVARQAEANAAAIDAVCDEVERLRARVPVACEVCRGESAVCPHCRSPGPTVTGTSAIEVERGDPIVYACCGGPWTDGGNWRCSVCAGRGAIWEDAR